MTTKTDKKDPGEWGGLVCFHAFARPVLVGTGDRGCVFARPATAGTVINGLTNIQGHYRSLIGKTLETTWGREINLHG